MSLLPQPLEAYLDALMGSEDPVLREMEALAAERGFPIVGPQVGHLLRVLAQAVGARKVLELGSGFGYSAYHFAAAMGAEGRVVLTEGSAEQADEARRFLQRGGLLDRTEIHVGEALEIAARLEGPFDIVFNDVHKAQYPDVYPLALRLVRPGGLFLSDNMLWQGKVLSGPPDDASTQGVRRLTELLFRSGEFHSVLVPLRDGVTVSVRRSDADHGS